jgi:hypothetical protein
VLRPLCYESVPQMQCGFSSGTDLVLMQHGSFIGTSKLTQDQSFAISVREESPKPLRRDMALRSPLRSSRTNVASISDYNLSLRSPRGEALRNEN